MRIRALVLVLVTGFLAGCTSTIELTVASTRNIEFSQPQERVGSRVEETAGRFRLLIIPLGRAPEGRRVLSDLLTETEADYLTNVQVTTLHWSLILLGYESVKVQGDPWRARK